MTPVLGQEAAKPSGVEAVKITDKNHPDFVRCRTEDVIGSRAKKKRMCMTNRQWLEIELESKGLARKMADQNSGYIGIGN